MSDNKSRQPQRRHSQVYVDVPHSSHLRPPSSEQSLKENTPLRPSKTNRQAHMSILGGDGTRSKKRKLIEDDDQDSSDETLTPKAKKPKVASAPQPSGKANAAPNKRSKTAATSPADVPSDEYPHGYFYCHQCNRKRDRSEGLHCTYKNSRPKVHNERCRMRYCKACLKNRYQKDMDAIQSRDIAGLPKKDRDRHILTDGYWFQCPKCQDECNCRVCRKAKGLEPTGNLNLKARQAEKAAAAVSGKDIVDGAGPSTSNKTGKLSARKVNKMSKTQKAVEVKSSKAPRAAPEAKAKPAPKPKPLPKPVWTRVATDLTITEAETRLHIREFCLRFASPLQLTLNHLDELEEPSGDNLGSAGGWDDNVDSDQDIIAWVSEFCAKSVIQGLLDVIATGADARNEHADATALREASKTVKASGANLNRVWGALTSLRETLGSDSIAFANPLPPPATTTIRTTRRGMQGKDSQNVYIANSAQLIPVIADLIGAALQSPAIRDALEAGSTDEKELSRSVKEAVSNENTRWKNLSESKDKARRERHNTLLRDLEFSHRIAATRFAPRFSPLGRDTEGRLYFRISPGVGESEAAVQLINGKDTRVKIGRKRVFTEDDRQEMQRWSWFVAVWGKKPEGAMEAESLDTNNEEERDEDEECWWGFYQPEEITKLADWLAIKCGIVDDSDSHSQETNGRPNHEKGMASTSSSVLTGLTASRAASPLSELSDTDVEERCAPLQRELSDLVRGLRDYAEVLEWRIQRASRDTMVEKSGKDVHKTGPIPTNKFYA